MLNFKPIDESLIEQLLCVHTIYEKIVKETRFIKQTFNSFLFVMLIRVFDIFY